MFMSIISPVKAEEVLKPTDENAVACVDDGTCYSSLSEAVDKVVKSESKKGTVTLLKDASDGGIGLFRSKGAIDVNLTIDFGGHTYTCMDPATGSTGTESQGFHFEKGNTVKLMNGTIQVDESSEKTKMLIQNYCDVTLENLNLFGNDITQYIISSNYGDMVMKNVSIDGTHSDMVGIDLMHWLNDAYRDKAPTIVIDNTADQMIKGSINVYCYGTGSATCEQKPTLTLNGGVYEANITEYIAEGTKVVETEQGYQVVPMTTGIQLNRTSLDMKVDETQALVASLLPSGAIEDILWKSSDEMVATVDQKGNVKAVSEGTAIITVYAGAFEEECKVTVTKAETEIIIETDDTLDPTTAEDVQAGMTSEDMDTAIKVVSETIEYIKTIEGNTSSVVNEICTAFEDGKDINTQIVIEQVEENKIASSDVQIVETALTQIQETLQAEEGKIVQYLDINLLITVDGNEVGKLNQLKDTITLSIALPEKLQVEGRQFYIVRIHGDEVTRLPLTENADGTYSFETDRFSTYALIYVDGAKTEYLTESETMTLDPSTSPSEDGTDGDKTPDTSAVMMTSMFAMMTLLSAGIVLVLKKKKELTE